MDLIAGLASGTGRAEGFDMDVTVDQMVVFAILLGTLFLFVWGRWRYDLVAIGALLLVYMAGLPIYFRSPFCVAASAHWR